MITNDQEKWLDHLSDEKKIWIFPFDPTAEVKFQIIKKKIQSVLGENIPVVHRGATSLGISGQDEIDVYIPVLGSDFAALQPKLEELFGEPRAIYPLQRIRFATDVDNKHIDLFLINKEHTDWINGTTFEEYCKANPETLEEYKLLKERLSGTTVKEFYRQKIEFINSVMEKAKLV